MSGNRQVTAETISEAEILKLFEAGDDIIRTCFVALRPATDRSGMRIAARAKLAEILNARLEKA